MHPKCPMILEDCFKCFIFEMIRKIVSTRYEVKYFEIQEGGMFRYGQQIEIGYIEPELEINYNLLIPIHYN